MLTNCQINNYLFTSQIGSGAYGVVFKAADVTTGDVYAIKAVIKPSTFNPVNSIGATAANLNVKKSNVLLTQLYHYFKTFQNKLFLPSTDLVFIRDIQNDQLNNLVPHYREIALHLKVQDHNNIVTIHQVLESPLATFIVMDYYQTDLFTSIVERQHFIHDGLLIKKVYLQLCSALKHCHSKSVFHCDIKPENILLDENDNIYLCDFGLATTQDHLAPNVCVGSSYYMAPERVHCNNPHDLFPTATGDIWSIGIILINLTCIRNPWSKAHQNDDRTFHYYVQDTNVLKKILPLSEQLYVLLHKILKINPYDRIDLDTLMIEIAKLSNLTKDGYLKNVPILTDEQFNLYSYGEPIINSATSPNNISNDHDQNNLPLHQSCSIISNENSSSNISTITSASTTTTATTTNSIMNDTNLLITKFQQTMNTENPVVPSFLRNSIVPMNYNNHQPIQTHQIVDPDSVDDRSMNNTSQNALQQSSDSTPYNSEDDEDLKDIRCNTNRQQHQQQPQIQQQQQPTQYNSNPNPNTIANTTNTANENAWEPQPSYHQFQNSLQYLQMNMPTTTSQSDSTW